jgi:hypothetical protein
MQADLLSTIARRDEGGGPRQSAFPQLQLPPPPKRSWIDAIFAEEIVRCMIEAQRPTRDEVDRVAARIWSEIQDGGVRIAWRDLLPGSKFHRQMVAAARAALGD